MATRYMTLKQERHDLEQQIAEGRAENAALLDQLDTESRDWTDEERAAHSATSAKLKGYDARARSVDEQLLAEESRREHERNIPDSHITNIHDRAGDKPWGTDTGAAFGEFLQAVHSSRMHNINDPRLFQAAGQGMNETGGADGGFAVQTDQASGILKLMYDSGQILSRIKPLPLGANSNGIKINALKETSRATGSRFGGITGYWIDEGTAPTGSRPKFRKISLELRKVGALGYATDELLADAVALESVMTQGFADELTFLTEDAVWEGVGAGMPQGIINSAALISVAKETGQAASTIVYENVSKMWARVWARSRATGAWFYNQDCEPQINQMSAVIGTGGVPVYLPPGGLSVTPYANLYGRPLIPIEYASTLGTVGDLVFCDFGQYVLIEKAVQQASSMHVAFVTDEMAFRCIYRVDGQPLLESAITPFKGTGTLSPFVALATRA